MSEAWEVERLSWSHHLFSDCTARLESLASNPLGTLRSMSLFSTGLLAASNAWQLNVKLHNAWRCAARTCKSPGCCCKITAASSSVHKRYSQWGWPWRSLRTSESWCPVYIYIYIIYYIYIYYILYIYMYIHI